MHRTDKECGDLIRKLTGHFLEDLNRRGVPDPKSAGGCWYTLRREGEEEDRHCAVGMCMKPEYLKDANFSEMVNDMGAVETVIEKIADYEEFGFDDNDYEKPVFWNDVHKFDDILQEEYQGFPKGIWEDLQSWHDDDHWNWQFRTSINHPELWTEQQVLANRKMEADRLIKKWGE